MGKQAGILFVCLFVSIKNCDEFLPARWKEKSSRDGQENVWDGGGSRETTLRTSKNADGARKQTYFVSNKAYACDLLIWIFSFFSRGTSF